MGPFFTAAIEPFWSGYTIPKNRMMLVEVLKIFDMVCLIVSLLLVTILSDLPTAKVTLVQFLGMRVSVINIAIVFSFLLVWHVIMCYCKLYVSRRLSSFKDEIADVLKAISVGTFVLFILSEIANVRMINVRFIFMFWMNISALTITGRLLLRYGLKKSRLKGKNLRNIVIAGIHDRAMLFAHKISSQPEFGYRLVGFVDDAGAKYPAFDESGYQLVADLQSFPEFLRKQVVDEVMICLPVKSHYQQAAYIAAICEEHGIIVRFLSDIFNPKRAHTTIQQFEGHSIITFYTGHMVGGGVIVKRAIDFIFSLLLVVGASPLLMLTALLIKLSSKGPVYFVQKRLGVNKRYFEVYKFRTMYPDAEKRQAELEHLNEVHGAAFKIKNDPRITPVGKFLRKMSIDELPQLFNVLKGDMSLVGPRPLPIRDYEGFDKDWHRRRFSVRPGITCLWQISGRSNISFERWMELDMEYIDNWSLWLDAKILIGTIPAVLRGSGAQ